MPAGGMVVDCCGEPVSDRPGYTIRRVENSAGPLLRQLQSAKIVVTDSTCLLDRITKMGDQALALEFLVMALGKLVLDRRALSKCSRHGGPQDGVVHYTAAAFRQHCKLAITDALRQESPLVYDAIRLVVQLPKSVWASQRGEVAAVTLGSRNVVRSFLLSHRRAKHSGAGLLGGKYFRNSRN